jgi:hypothetical protein
MGHDPESLYEDILHLKRSYSTVDIHQAMNPRLKLLALWEKLTWVTTLHYMQAMYDRLLARFQVKRMHISLRLVKDYNGLRNIPCECGKIYV